MNHIILIGFMGCGKSSVGKRLAKVMNLPFVDMDAMIVEKSGMEITTIFETHGEAYFRKLETETLLELADSTEQMVISAGGGMPVQSQNQPILKEMGTVILLEASLDTLVERLQYDNTRPILKGGNLREKIESLQKERKAAYEQVGDVKIVTDGKNFMGIIDEIRKIVEKTTDII